MMLRATTSLPSHVSRFSFIFLQRPNSYDGSSGHRNVYDIHLTSFGLAYLYI